MESLLFRLAHLSPHESRLLAWGLLAFAAALAPLLAWRLARQRADIRSLSASLREGTKAGGALPRIPRARTTPGRRLAAELADWALRHSHQIQWMRGWTQKRHAEWRSLRAQLALLSTSAHGGTSPADAPGPEETEETLARAARSMEEALESARTLARAVKALEGAGGGPERGALHSALAGITRSLAEGAQFLEGAQRGLEAAGTLWPRDEASSLRRMASLAERVAEEHRKMEGSLAKLLEGFLPDEAPPRDEEASSVRTEAPLLRGE